MKPYVVYLKRKAIPSQDSSFQRVAFCLALLAPTIAVARPEQFEQRKSRDLLCWDKLETNVLLVIVGYRHQSL